MENEINLLPCPFCGSEAAIKENTFLDSCFSDPQYDIMCTNKDCYLCDGADWMFNTKEEAAILWNKRKNNND